jgi:predicted thioesterase
MEFSLQPGMTARIERIVTEDDTAVRFGSGEVQVFATPMMIALMEKAALTAVDPHLPQGYATVGTTVEIAHLAATPVGMTVYATAELVEVDGKKLRFKIEAFDEQDKIGEGWHGRYIIKTDRFLEATRMKAR